MLRFTPAIRQSFLHFSTVGLYDVY